MSDKEKAESNKNQNEITDTDKTVMDNSNESKQSVKGNESNQIIPSTVTRETISKPKREIYDYMKLVFRYFIFGLVIVACLFVYLLNKVPTDKLIIDFSLGDGVISIIATLIGVMVTFAIGYQILNAIQIKEQIDVFESKLNKSMSDTKEEINERTDKKINEFNYIINKTIDYVELKNELKDIAKKVSECDMGKEKELKNLSILFIKQLLDLFEYSNNSNITKIDFDRQYYIINYFTQLSTVLQYFITADNSIITNNKSIISQRIKTIIEKEANTIVKFQLENIMKCISENDEQYINKIIDDM